MLIQEDLDAFATTWYGSIVFSLLLLMAIFVLSHRHSREIYIIWYIFSFFFWIFVGLYAFVARVEEEFTEYVVGQPVADAFIIIYNYLTDVQGEVRLIGAVVVLAVLPQLSAYVLSGLSGSATPPMFVRQISRIAIWSLIKFVATLSGILLAYPPVQFFLGYKVDTSKVFQGIFLISVAFILAAWIAVLEERGLLPQFLVYNRRELGKIHNFFTRHSRQPAMSSDAEKTPERER